MRFDQHHTTGKFARAIRVARHATPRAVGHFSAFEALGNMTSQGAAIFDLPT
ncbi:MAG: hypothetical protein AB3N24_03910 [Leisingera sp.]